MDLWKRRQTPRTAYSYSSMTINSSFFDRHRPIAVVSDVPVLRVCPRVLHTFRPLAETHLTAGYFTASRSPRSVMTSSYLRSVLLLDALPHYLQISFCDRIAAVQDSILHGCFHHIAKDRLQRLSRSTRRTYGQAASTRRGLRRTRSSIVTASGANGTSLFAAVAVAASWIIAWMLDLRSRPRFQAMKTLTRTQDNSAAKTSAQHAVRTEDRSRA